MCCNFVNALKYSKYIENYSKLLPEVSAKYWLSNKEAEGIVSSWKSHYWLKTGYILTLRSRVSNWDNTDVLMILITFMVL